MKQVLSILFIMFISSISAQKIGVQQLETTTRMITVEEKSEFFYSKKFVKESSNKDSKIKFVKKNFIKQTQEFDEEIITLFGDTITYTLRDPKKFINFKKAVELSYKKTPQANSNSIIYKKGFFTILFMETESSSEELNKSIKNYNFSIYKTEK